MTGYVLAKGAHLEDLLPELSERYANARPFRHLVIDGFLDEADASAIAGAFPKPQGVDRILATLFAARTYSSDLSDVDQRILRVFELLGSATFIAWLEQLTGIAQLRIDADFVGAGLHQAVNGSSLPVHADHNTHPKDGTLYRRLNLLIYMNPQWRAEWGGILELWDRDGKAPVTTVEPILNRCIIMEVNDQAFHGYRPLKTPDGIARNAVVAYYYAPEPSPLQEPLPHPTLFAATGQTAPERIARRVRHGLLLRVLALKKRFANVRSWAADRAARRRR